MEDITTMIDLIEDNYESLRRLCKQYRVKRLEVFGSALSGDGFDAEKSDLDFLVEFLPLAPGANTPMLISACSRRLKICSTDTSTW